MRKKTRHIKKKNKRDFYVYKMHEKYADPSGILLKWKGNLRIVHGLVDTKKWRHYCPDKNGDTEIDGYWLYKNNFIYFCICAEDNSSEQHEKGVSYTRCYSTYKSYHIIHHSFIVNTKKSSLDATDLAIVLTKLEGWFLSHPDMLSLENFVRQKEYRITEIIFDEDIF